MKFLKRLLSLPYWLYHKYISKDDFKANMGYWFWIDGNEKHLLKHELNNESLVFEVGGFTGVFTEDIIKRFDSHVYVFEPVKEYIEVLKQKFNPNPKVTVFEYGLGAKSEKIFINLIGDKSSVFRETEANAGQESINIVDIDEFLVERETESIDLIAINIEGGEYELLERMIETGQIHKFDRIQVQFHDVLLDSADRRDKIISSLNETHDHVFSVPFVWDGFKLKESQ